MMMFDIVRSKASCIAANNCRVQQHRALFSISLAWELSSDIGSHRFLKHHLYLLEEGSFNIESSFKSYQMTELIKTNCYGCFVLRIRADEISSRHKGKTTPYIPTPKGRGFTAIFGKCHLHGATPSSSQTILSIQYFSVTHSV